MDTKMIQIRHVPDSLHSQLKARASKAGTSLSEYLLGELERIARLPTRQEMLERLKRLKPVEVDISPVDVLREERERR
jgi:hypothetical protein